MTKDLASAAVKLEGAVDDAAAELRRACTAVDYSDLDLDFADVILGFLARQYQLWTVLTFSPSAWTSAAYPLLLRGLADATITMAWIIKNPTSAQKFKIYSAGRLKLLAGHWRARAPEEAESLQSTYVQELEELASSEQWVHILPVELSNWNSKDIRTMAQEADLKDLYDLGYSPLSADAHAEWMVLRTKYLRKCDEPLHKSHWLPVFKRPYLDTRMAIVATVAFRESIELGLKALNLEYNSEFWERLEKTVSAASALASSRTADNGETAGKSPQSD